MSVAKTFFSDTNADYVAERSGRRRAELAGLRARHGHQHLAVRGLAGDDLRAGSLDAQRVRQVRPDQRAGGVPRRRDAGAASTSTAPAPGVGAPGRRRRPRSTSPCRARAASRPGSLLTFTGTDADGNGTIASGRDGHAGCAGPAQRQRHPRRPGRRAVGRGPELRLGHRDQLDRRGRVRGRGRLRVGGRAAGVLQRHGCEVRPAADDPARDCRARSPCRSPTAARSRRPTSCWPTRPTRRRPATPSTRSAWRPSPCRPTPPRPPRSATRRSAATSRTTRATPTCSPAPGASASRSPARWPRAQSYTLSAQVLLRDDVPIGTRIQNCAAIGRTPSPPPPSARAP